MPKLKLEFGLELNKFFAEKNFNLPETYSNNFTLEKLFITDEGFIGVVMMNRFGFRCGYVGIPKDLVSVDKVDLNCHGGITYTGTGVLDEFFKKILESFEIKKLSDSINFFGWDYGHADDIPDIKTFSKYCSEDYSIPEFWDNKISRKMWTQEDVIPEVKSVSTQLNNPEFLILNQNNSKVIPKKRNTDLNFIYGNNKLCFSRRLKNEGPK